MYLTCVFIVSIFKQVQFLRFIALCRAVCVERINTKIGLFIQIVLLGLN